MLAIRPEQMQVFTEAAVKRFEDLMVVHLNKFFPERSKAAGETNVREFIRYGVKRAAAHNITAKRDVSRYIDLMATFGSDFDTDEKLPWAREILATTNSSEVRMSVLLKTAQKHLQGK